MGFSGGCEPRIGCGCDLGFVKMPKKVGQAGGAEGKVWGRDRVRSTVGGS